MSRWVDWIVVAADIVRYGVRAWAVALAMTPVEFVRAFL